MTEPKPRRRFISVGETIALAALAVSGFGVWIAWSSSQDKGPTRIVEQRQAIPLTLRGRAQDDGRVLEISPVEASHALQSLTIKLAGSASPISVGSDGALSADDVEDALGKPKDDAKGRQRVRASIEAHYVEAGDDKRATGNYVITYRWEGGGLFGGRSLRLISFSRG